MAHARPFRARKRPIALLAVALLASSAGGIAGAAPALAASPVEVTNATLEWGYSKYAQVGVFGAWQQSVSGAGVTLAAQDGAEASGDSAEAGITYTLVNFQGGTGSVDPGTGAGRISWPDAGSWSVNAVPMLGAPAVEYRAPVLDIAADRTGELSFLVSAGSGQGMGGEESPAQPAERVTVMEFSDAAFDGASGKITAVPTFEGVHYENAAGVQLTIPEGGAWPSEYIAALPDAVRAFHYKTANTGLQLKKGPLPFTVTTGAVDQTAKIELFAADGTTPLANSPVAAGDTIIVRGTGFDPEANNPGGTGSGLPIPNNLPQGTFVTFGAVLDPWKPSQAGPAENRAQVRSATRWVLSQEVIDSLPESLHSRLGEQAVILADDGSFSAEVSVQQPDQVPAGAAYGIYTYAGGAAGVVNPDQEFFIPVNFSPAGGAAPSEPNVPVEAHQLSWGFKSSWRSYVSGVAAGATHAGSGARVSEDGTFRYAVADVTGFDPASNSGVIKFDGRIRFQSALHGFDIVLEKPWITAEPGKPAVLSAAVSTSATVGQLGVARADLALLDFTAPKRSDSGAGEVLSWSGIPARFVEQLPLPEWSRYAGQPADPVSLSIRLDQAADPDPDPGPDSGTPAIEAPGATTPGAPVPGAPGGNPASPPAAVEKAPAQDSAASPKLAATGGEPVTGPLAAAATLSLIGAAALAAAHHRSRGHSRQHPRPQS